MNIAFISDIHLTPERPEEIARFTEFLATVSGRYQQLYILGDLFEYWIGDDGNEALGYQVIEEQLRALTEQQIAVYFIHGNRDFLIGEAFSQRTGIELLPDPCVITINDEQYILSHGDAFCSDDIEHQKARALFLNPEWQAQILAKSIPERIDIARQIRMESGEGKQQKSMQIMDVTQATIEQTMRSYGIFKMIHGHTHRPAIHRFHIDDQEALRIVLGDWYEQTSVLTFNDQGFTQQF